MITEQKPVIKKYLVSKVDPDIKAETFLDALNLYNEAKENGKKLSPYTQWEEVFFVENMSVEISFTKETLKSLKEKKVK